MYHADHPQVPHTTDTTPSELEQPQTSDKLQPTSSDNLQTPTKTLDNLNTTTGNTENATNTARRVGLFDRFNREGKPYEYVATEVERERTRVRERVRE